LFYSADDGGHWTALNSGLPHAPVSWAVVQKNFHDLVVSTYGRGLYILDDITPLEQQAQQAKKNANADAAATLFEPRSTYRFTRGGQAFLNFSVKSAPKEQVEIEVVAPDGTSVRKIRTRAKAGLNRVRWDLHYEPPRLVALRT